MILKGILWKYLMPLNEPLKSKVRYVTRLCALGERHMLLCAAKYFWWICSARWCEMTDLSRVSSSTMLYWQCKMGAGVAGFVAPHWYRKKQNKTRGYKDRTIFQPTLAATSFCLATASSVRRQSGPACHHSLAKVRRQSPGSHFCLIGSK